MVDTIKKSKKSILFICPVFPPYKSGGGQSQVARDYAEGLSKKGYNVFVITTLFDGLKKEEKINGINIIRFQSCSKFLLKFGLYNPKGLYNWLKTNIKNFNFIFIHDIYTLYGFMVAKFCKKNKIPYILMPHGMGNISKQKDKVLLKKIFIFLFSAFVSRNANKIIFCSENEKKDYEIPYKYSEVITNGINQDLWIKELEKIDKEDINEFRIKYGLGNKKIIFSMGRLVKAKRFDKLIDYIGNFLKANEEYMLLIVGPNGGELQNLIIQIEGNGLDKNIKIIEGLFDKEKTIIFNISSLFILASDLEGFPIVICEAISSRIPCLISNGCNIMGSDGFVEIFSDKKDFLKKITKLKDNEIKIDDYYIKSFDINNSITNVDKLIIKEIN